MQVANASGRNYVCSVGPMSPSPGWDIAERCSGKDPKDWHVRLRVKCGDAFYNPQFLLVKVKHVLCMALFKHPPKDMRSDLLQLPWEDLRLATGSRKKYSRYVSIMYEAWLHFSIWTPDGMDAFCWQVFPLKPHMFPQVLVILSKKWPFLQWNYKWWSEIQGTNFTEPSWISQGDLVSTRFGASVTVPVVARTKMKMRWPVLGLFSIASCAVVTFFWEFVIKKCQTAGV